MRIFKDLEFVEQLGSGIPRIIQHYGKDCFQFSENFLRMSFPISEKGGQMSGQIGGQMSGQIDGQMSGQIDGAIENLTERQREVLKLIDHNSKISRKVISEKLGINESAVQKHIDSLKDKDIIRREGGTRGFWLVLPPTQ